MISPKMASNHIGGKLIELDKHINKSHENEENNNLKEIPEILLEDLNLLKSNSMISHESLEKVQFS